MNGGGLPAYGLTANPFTTVTLNPLINPADKKCVSLVDGWKDLSDAEELIHQRVAADRAVFFVVAGTSKTGKTSVAYYLMHVWAEACGVRSDLVVAHCNDPGAEGGSFSPERQLMKWAHTLRLREDIDELGLSPTTKERLAKLKESDETVDFGLAFRAVDKDLRTPAQGREVHCLAAVLERGKGDDLVKTVRECFQVTKAIVIITVDESSATVNLLKNARDALPPGEGMCINVGPIQGADVATIVQDRWDAVRKGVDNPFDLNDVVQVFNSPRTIARTIRLLERMLDLRHRLRDAKALWPGSPNLALTGDVMLDLLADFESTLPD